MMVVILMFNLLIRKIYLNLHSAMFTQIKTSKRNRDVVTELGNVKIGDDYTIEFDAGLNTSHEDRKKMSIINALLSLNQEAMNIYYPFISDAPTSNFDIDTSQKYLYGIKDIFKQSIIMTKDVDIQSESYKRLLGEGNVGRIYVLESNIFVPEGQEPEKHEVSTIVKVLK